MNAGDWRAGILLATDKSDSRRMFPRGYSREIRGAPPLCYFEIAAPCYTIFFFFFWILNRLYINLTLGEWKIVYYLHSKLKFCRGDRLEKKRALMQIIIHIVFKSRFSVRLIKKMRINRARAKRRPVASIYFDRYKVHTWAVSEFMKIIFWCFWYEKMSE